MCRYLDGFFLVVYSYTYSIVEHTHGHARVARSRIMHLLNDCAEPSGKPATLYASHRICPPIRRRVPRGGGLGLRVGRSMCHFLALFTRSGKNDVPAQLGRVQNGHITAGFLMRWVSMRMIYNDDFLLPTARAHVRTRFEMDAWNPDLKESDLLHDQ